MTLANANNWWNRYRIWKPLGLLVLASVTPPQWDIKVIDENLKTIGTVFDVFGPTASPYIAVKPKGKIPKTSINHILYVTASKSGKKKWRKRK